MKIIFDSEEQKNLFFHTLDNFNLPAGLCPRNFGFANFGFVNFCSGSCSECWKSHIKLEVRDYKQQAEKMISDGTVAKSEFYDILVGELAKYLKNEDQKKEQ